VLDAFRRELTEIVWIARWKQYKVVEFVDATRGALLFDLTEADAVTDRLNGAAEHPEVLANVRACVREHGRGGMHLALPDAARQG